MLHLLIAIIGIFLTILFVVGTHEFAHFFVARLFGIKVLQFSIGFGKRILHWRGKSGTEYVFALIPLGGYVKMLDENEGDVAASDLPYAYNQQPFYKKFLIVLAGPTMNLFCAFILYWIIFMIGFVTPRPIIGTVAPHSIAAEAGLLPKQEIITVDHKVTDTWTNVVFRLLAHAGNEDHLHVETIANKESQPVLHTLDLSDWHMDSLTPDPLKSLGITPFEPVVPLVVGQITNASPAAKSGLQLGDRIKAINKIPTQDWNDLITIVMNHPDETLPLTIERNGHSLTIPITIGYQRDFLFKKHGYLGIGPNYVFPPELLHTIQYSPLAAIPYAWQEVCDLSYFNLVLFGKMITGKLSLQSLGGPITIFESAGNALNYGFLPFISFLAFLSICIGIINLMPIPGLDGGHLLIQLIEFVTRRPVPLQVLNLLYRLGFIFVLLILFQALINDILRL